MRLFSAIVPPPEVVDDLAGWLAGHKGDLPAELRWTPVDRWHVSLGFFGDDDDPVRRARWLTRRAEGRPAPRLRIAGAGTFPGVLWARVHTDDERVLGQLAKAAGAGRRGYRPHLTLARWRSGKPDEMAMVEPFEGYSGPWFTPDVLLLMRSEPGRSGPTYTTVERLPLAHT
jgi:RNA 2',3'-cyclic 3'-phosphodiesterase